MNARWILMLVFVLAACADDQPPLRTATVKAADYGDAWPLLALQAQIGCDPPSAVYIEVNGKRYALNGKALSAGLPRGDEISKTGNAVALGLFVERASSLCQGRG